MTRELAEQKLLKIFGLPHFYDEQWEAISRLLNGERILMIQRTGFGKSLCYQFPATQFDGITVVFSPLIALMRDQVNGLKSKGINAGCINSEQSMETNQETIEAALQGKLKILYIAPERQGNISWQESVKDMKISMVVIDEAHTISTWGHDFRPAFRRIIDLVKLLPESCPVLATTATATLHVQKDIEQQIGGRLSTIRGSLARQNFNLYVVRVSSENEKMLWLADNINNMNGTGIIYVGTRANTELYSKWLQNVGIKAIEYNASFDADTRMKIEKGLMDNKWKCVVSTNALGMGIDKPDIRFVIHTQMPASPIHYYQEIGRAGRDGKPTTIILFYNEHIDKVSDVEVDMKLPISFIEGSRPSEQKYLKVIEILQHEPLTEKELTLKSNLKQTQFRVIKSDLINQKIMREVEDGKRKILELTPSNSSCKFDYSLFNEIRKSKYEDLNAMREYVMTKLPRMKYLCRFLDSVEDVPNDNCDNTNLPVIKVKENPTTQKKLQEFMENFFPELNLSENISRRPVIDGKKTSLSLRYIRPNLIEVKVRKDSTSTLIDRRCDISQFSSLLEKDEYTILKEMQDDFLEKKSHITDGVASSYYGESLVGEAIHHCKYQDGGDFPDFLLRRTLKAFRKAFSGVKFDMVMYVPPTKSGNLVKNFAEKFAKEIEVTISDGIIKKRETEEQKICQNRHLKQSNVKDAFEVNACVKGKTILLVDDVYDSGATLKEIGQTLTKKGANYICPIVIAKTIGGTD